MSLSPGMKVLDVGCGVGGPAREIARFADVSIVGLNNNDFQIQRARKYTKDAGLQGQVTFAKGDFMKLSEQFGENSFDAGGFLSFFSPRFQKRCMSAFHSQCMPLKLLSMHLPGKVYTARSRRSSNLAEL
jgi:SAM-dependent methyltransferase